MDCKTVLHTDGKGLWSSYKAAIAIQRLEARYAAKDRHFGELKVHFDTTTWHTATDGLIYTDELFLSELCSTLLYRGFGIDGVRSIRYSEHGMQQDSYVSFDVWEPFLNDYSKLSDINRKELEASWYANWGNLSFLDKL